MYHRTLITLILAATTASAGPAFGSATLACSLADRNIELELQGVVSHGLGEGLVSAEGEGKASITILKSDLTAFKLDRESITQYWLGKQDMRLRIYRESSGPVHETLDIQIEANSKGGGDDTIDYQGTYSGQATSMAGVTGSEAKSVTFKGKVSCQIE